MKILHVITSLQTGGAEKMLIDIVECQISMGNEVEIYVLKKSGSNFEKRLENLCKVNYGRSGKIYSIIALLDLCRFTINRKFSIVHSHLTAPQIYVSALKHLRLLRGSTVTTEHNTFNRRRSHYIFKMLDKFIYSGHNAVICITEATRKALTEWVPSTSSRSVVVENGINLSKYLDALPAEIGYERPIVVSVSRFEEQKNQDAVIRALSKIDKGTLLLVGDGVRKEILEKLVKDLELKERVVFMGIRDDVPAILKGSDIFVQSSHWEGFGLAAVEAMASGLPVVVSDVAGLRDVVGSAGRVFPPDDDAALAHIIEELSNKALAEEIGALCRKRAEEFSIVKTVDAYQEIYKKIERL